MGTYSVSLLRQRHLAFQPFSFVGLIDPSKIYCLDTNIPSPHCVFHHSFGLEAQGTNNR